VLIGLPVSLTAQQAITSATLGGRVEDPSGAAVAGVTVTIRNRNRDQQRSTQSDRQGRYQFLYLTPGDYDLSVAEPRFQPFERRLALSLGQAVDLPVVLHIAGMNQSIEVTDAPLTLEAVRTQSSDTVSPRAIDSLPLNGRNYLDLALLVPGVSRTNTGAPQQFAETSAVPGTGISVSGQRNLNNSFIVDGLSSNDDAAGLAGTFYSQEVIREFQVISSGGNAEFGRASSGVVNIATKSGTNTWHGRVYDFTRNQRFDARNALASRKDPLTQTQFGASLGGPLVRSRTFLFSNFEQTRRQAAGIVTIAPSNVAAINTQLDAIGYAGPRIGTGEFGTGYDTTNYFARVDHQLSSSNQFIARYSLYDISSPNSRSVGSLNAVSRGTRLDNRDQTVALSDVAALSARDLNEVRFQFTRSHLSAPGNDLIGPAVSISGVANFGASTSSPVRRNDGLYELSETLSLQRGSHFFKAGADFLYNRLDINFPGAQIAAVYSFSSLAAFQAGRYSTFQQAFGDPNQFQSNPNVGLFAQDEWKPTANLTFNLGLRYDLQKLPSPIQTNTRNFAPRFGIAWSPANRRTVIRASYGLYYDRIPLRATSNALQRDGSKYRVALLAFGQDGAPVFPQQLSAFPAGQYINISTIDPRIGNSYSHQVNFQVEHQLGRSTAVTLGYQWVRALHLILSRNVNVPTLSAADAVLLGVPNLGRPDSRYGNVSRYEGSGDSYYNGLLASVKTRLWNGGEVRISYTFSKAIDDVGNFFFSTPQNNNNLRDDRGLSDNDQRHRVSVAAVMQSPVRPGASWGRAVLGGWELSPLLVYTSALPYNVLLNYDRNSDTSLNDRPAGVGRNTGRGFDYLSLDVRLSRVFRLTERLRLDALMESFNTLNRANWTLPNNVIGSGAGAPLPTFGRPTAVFDPRQMQVGLRLNF
jgi:hypothetical protein